MRKQNEMELSSKKIERMKNSSRIEDDAAKIWNDLLESFF